MLSLKFVQNFTLTRFTQKCATVPVLQRKLNFRTKFTNRQDERDLENWMGNLRTDLKSIPVINLAIPGTHDSMTFGINKTSKVAPDANPLIADLFKMYPDVCRRWSKCQELTALEQLKKGIRYFDIRIARNIEDNKFYYTHALYADEITESLEEISQFLDNHPDEFVILDCQHMYQMELNDYIRLANKMQQIFKHKLICQNDGNLTDLTLEKVKSTKKQVLVIFRNNIFIPQEFWPNEAYQTLWPHTVDVNVLKTFLDKAIKDRPKDTGHITQCVLTPTKTYIFERLFSSLKDTVATTIAEQLPDWISDQKPGIYQDSDIPTRNVFIADFINLHDFEFVKRVIDLNNKIPVKE